MAPTKPRAALEPIADARSEMREAPRSQTIAQAICTGGDLLGLINPTPGAEGKPGAPTPKPTPHYHGHRERLRERFHEAGAAALSDYELLELVLFRALPRRDVKPLAKDLIARFGSFAEVVNAPEALLAKVPGVGEGTVIDIKLIAAAASRVAKGAIKTRETLSSWSAVIDVLPHGDGVRRQGAIPHPVSRQAQPADRRRGAADRHRRSHPGLSARGGQARARTVGNRHHPRAQSPVRRSDAVERRHPDDESRSSRSQAPSAFPCTTTSSSARTGTRV